MRKLTKESASNVPVAMELIERRIYLIRGHKVMLDSHSAELYQVPTKSLISLYAATKTASHQILCFSSPKTRLML